MDLFERILSSEVRFDWEEEEAIRNLAEGYDFIVDGHRIPTPEPVREAARRRLHATD